MLSKSDVLKLINEEEVVEVLRELIRKPSQNPPGNEKVVAEYIHTTMKDWGFDPLYVCKPEPERPSIAVVYKGTEGKLNPDATEIGIVDKDLKFHIVSPEKTKEYVTKAIGGS